MRNDEKSDKNAKGIYSGQKNRLNVGHFGKDYIIVLE